MSQTAFLVNGWTGAEGLLTRRSFFVYAALKPLLLSIAYEMVGAIGEAEDIVQEAFMRFIEAAEGREIPSPKAWLATVATRLATNHVIQLDEHAGRGEIFRCPVVQNAVETTR